MNESITKYLIVDRNLCYSSMLSDAILKHDPTAIIDRVVNVFELRRRLITNGYRKIFADASSYDSSIILHELEGVHTPMTIWDASNKPRPETLIEEAPCLVSHS